ncbi:MAG: hypothetical protein FP826_05780, partial [Sphingomonadales bacterium]|nr:hypothetical protein [Sphingomonadales bacterium]
PPGYGPGTPAAGPTRVGGGGVGGGAGGGGGGSPGHFVHVDFSACRSNSPVEAKTCRGQRGSHRLNAADHASEGRAVASNFRVA